MMTFSSVVELRFPRRGNVGGLCRVAIPPENDCMALTELRFPGGNDEEATCEQRRSEALHMKRLTLG